MTKHPHDESLNHNKKDTKVVIRWTILSIHENTIFSFICVSHIDIPAYPCKFKKIRF